MVTKKLRVSTRPNTLPRNDIFTRSSWLLISRISSKPTVALRPATLAASSGVSGQGSSIGIAAKRRDSGELGRMA